MTEAVFEAEKNSKFLREMYFHTMLHLRVAVASSTNIRTLLIQITLVIVLIRYEISNETKMMNTTVTFI